MDWNGFRGRAKKLEDITLPKLGQLIGVGEDELHAFLDVETSGHGFDPSGRPVILTEPHVFYRNLRGQELQEAVKRGLAYKTWGAKAYPRTPDLRYEWLRKAMEINETAALKACSWGLGQVLGENHVAAGYDTVQQFVEAMMDSEEKQLHASIDFIINNHLDKALREHDWAAFAKGYNGKNYRANKYDTKLAAAFAKWQRIKDTPYPPPYSPPTAKVAPKQVTIAVGTGAVVTAVAGGTGLFEWLSNIPCNWFGLFCGVN